MTPPSILTYRQNYCTASTIDKTIDTCSNQQVGFVFEPVQDFHLDGSVASKRDIGTDISNDVTNIANEATSAITNALGNDLVKALQAYQTASYWMSIAFEVALWTSVATAVAGILAIFSRVGSFITWFLSITATIFSFGAACTATVIFVALYLALKGIFNPLHIEVNLGTTFLAMIWISALLNMGATMFWLFSVCCCSGKSNPHHRGNKGGLWHAGDDEKHGGRQSMRVEQTGGSYSRVPSPYAPSDRVPLIPYPQQQTPQMHSTTQFPQQTAYGHGERYEPFTQR